MFKHLWQMISVSLQSSQQKGIMANIPPVSQNKKQHQAIVTPPTLEFLMLSVFSLQTEQNDISPKVLKLVIFAFFFY